VSLAVELERRELRFLVDGIPAISTIFPAPKEAPFILAQWKILASRTDATARLTGKKLATELKKVSLGAERHIIADVIRLQEEITAAKEEIAVLERRINDNIYRLHDLTADEIEMIEAAV